jgi:DNA-binding NarL/FixJ family response regulator
VSRPGRRDGDRVSPEHGDIRILLVDDDETWARSMAELLERERATITVEVVTSLDAASAALTDVIDCVVCDHRLESGTGLDLLAQVREVDSRPFILITGQGDESVASDAISQRVTDYIPKRFLASKNDLLARRIESTVRSYRTEQALRRERRTKEAMLDILTGTSSREGLAREFCEHLVGERGYGCAWVGTGNDSGRVVPLGAAGSSGYVDSVVDMDTTLADATEPALVALAEDDVTVEGAIRGGSSDDWEVVAREHGFESALGVPLEHDGAVFGVLAVYKSTGGVGPAEPTQLEEYGESLGYALRSARWKESLLSPTPVAVELELGGDAVPLVAFDGNLPDGARTSVLMTVPREETLLYVLEVTGADEADLAGLDDVEDVTADIADGDTFRCELAAPAPAPEMQVADCGGRVVDVTVSDGRSTVTATHEQKGIDMLLDRVRSVFPGASVRAIRSAGSATPDPMDTELLDPLTDKQHRALELAYYDGYFKRPRDHDTTEIAEKLGVTRQTLTHHLRAGQEKLFERLLDSDTPEG